MSIFLIIFNITPLFSAEDGSSGKSSLLFRHTLMYNTVLNTQNFVYIKCLRIQQEHTLRMCCILCVKLSRFLKSLRTCVCICSTHNCCCLPYTILNAKYSLHTLSLSSIQLKSNAFHFGFTTSTLFVFFVFYTNLLVLRDLRIPYPRPPSLHDC